MRRLRDCCEVVSGATPRTDNDAYWGGEIRWATPKDVSGLEYSTLYETPDKLTEAGYRSCSTKLVPPGSVLVSSRAPIGLVAIAGVEMCTNQGFKTLVPGPELNSSYLYHCMKASADRLASLGNGATFKEVSKATVENFEVPVPPLEAQIRIAAILDKAQDLRCKRKEALRLADQLLRATFFDLVGDPTANPRGWPERSISEIGIVTTGNTPDRSVEANFGNAIEWIKSDNINTPSHWLTIAREGLSTQGMRGARIVSEGSTLMTCIAGSPSCIGNVAMADRRVAFNQQINAITPKDDIDPKFLYLLLLFSKARIQATSTNSMKGMVSKGTLEKVRLIWPPRSLQDRLVQIFDRVAALRTRMEATDQLDLYASLQAQLLA